MKLWFSRDKTVSLRDQLVTQLILGIATGELPPGERLPSTRALARHHKIHPNTVSAAYRELESQHWVHSVRGSGVYVRTTPSETDGEALDRFALEFIRSARRFGTSATALRARIEDLLQPGPRPFVFVHEDEGLRRIMLAELRVALGAGVTGCDLSALLPLRQKTEAIFLTVPSREAQVRSNLSPAQELITLRISRVASRLAGYGQHDKESLLIVASGWPGFLAVARTILAAAGYAEESLLFRNTNGSDWKRGICSKATVVCDVVAAADVPNTVRKIVFPLLSEDCIRELQCCQHFYAVPV